MARATNAIARDPDCCRYWKVRIPRCAALLPAQRPSNSRRQLGPSVHGDATGRRDIRGHAHLAGRSQFPARRVPGRAAMRRRIRARRAISTNVHVLYAAPPARPIRLH